jgi:general stress protein CsbA
MAQSKTEWWLNVIGLTAQRTPEYSKTIFIVCIDIIPTLSGI